MTREEAARVLATASMRTVGEDPDDVDRVAALARSLYTEGMAELAQALEVLTGEADERPASDPDGPCQHTEFTAAVAFARIADDAGRLEGLYAEVRARCEGCLSPVVFRGPDFGVLPDRPALSSDGLEARLPCRVRDQPEDFGLQLPGLRVTGLSATGGGDDLSLLAEAWHSWRLAQPWEATPLHLAAKVAEEAGEVLGAVLKMDGPGRDTHPEHGTTRARLELGQLLGVALVLAVELDADPLGITEAALADARRRFG